MNTTYIFITEVFSLSYVMYVTMRGERVFERLQN